MWWSDHWLVEVRVGLREVRVRPRWRLQGALLKDRVFCREYRRIYRGWRGMREFYTDWESWWWQFHKNVTVLLNHNAL